MSHGEPSGDPWALLRDLAYHQEAESPYEALLVVLFQLDPCDWKMGLDYIRGVWDLDLQSGVARTNGWAVPQVRLGPVSVNIGQPTRDLWESVHSCKRLFELTGMRFGRLWYERSIAQLMTVPWKRQARLDHDMVRFVLDDMTRYRVQMPAVLTVQLSAKSPDEAIDKAIARMKEGDEDYPFLDLESFKSMYFPEAPMITIDESGTLRATEDD